MKKTNKINRLDSVKYSRMAGNDVRYKYNAHGRVSEIQDGSGRQMLNYDELGNVSENIRTFAIPDAPNTYSFKMLFNYDSWNRMQSDKFSATGDSLNLPDAIGCPLDILHTDGEVVSYGYDCGGNLDFMKGQKGSETFSYVSALLYNEYGQRMNAEYGNGTSAKYTYDNLQRLSHLTTFDAQGNTMQDIDYTFDAVSNITMVDNAAPAPETDLYFYHSDHLGSASWITDSRGTPHSAPPI